MQVNRVTLVVDSVHAGGDLVLLRMFTGMGQRNLAITIGRPTQRLFAVPELLSRVVRPYQRCGIAGITVDRKLNLGIVDGSSDCIADRRGHCAVYTG